MPRIFISYRRDDSVGYAGRLYDTLAGCFGKEQVFMDVDTIRAGEDFVKAIHQSVGACNVLIALIGPNWLRSSGDRGRPRLYSPGDFVRVEIAYALARNIRVIPLLVARATMPLAADLPDDLKALHTLNALEIHDALYSESVQRLLRELRPGRRRLSLNWRSRATWIGLVALILTGFSALIRLMPEHGSSPKPDEIEAIRKEPGLDQMIKKPATPIKVRIPSQVTQLPPVVQEARSLLLRPGTHHAIGPRKPKVLWASYVPGEVLGIAANRTVFAWTGEGEGVSAVFNGKELWSYAWPYINVWTPKGFDDSGRLWLKGNQGSESYCFNSNGEGGRVPGLMPKNLADAAVYRDEPRDRTVCEGGQVNHPKAPKWTIEIDGNCQGWLPEEDTKGNIYAGSDVGTLYSISALGKVNWTYRLGAPLQQAPAFIFDDVLLGAKDGLYRLHDGVMRWKFPTKNSVEASEVFDREGTVYVHSYDHLIAIDAEGKQVWRVKPGTWPNENTGTPFGLDERGRLYIRAGDGVVCLGDQ